MPEIDLDKKFRYDKYYEKNARKRKYYLIFRCIYYIYLMIHMLNPFYWIHKYSLDNVCADGIFVTIYSEKEVKYCARKYGKFLAGIYLCMFNFDDYDYSDLLKYCPNIIYLRISIHGRSRNLESIYELKNLKYLHADQYFREKLELSGNSKLESITLAHKNFKNGIPYLPNLKHLVIRNFRNSNLSELQKFPKLESLYMIQSRNLESLIHISKLINLEYVSLYGLGKLKSLGDLGRLKNLRYLIFERCRNLSDISGISGAEALEYIYFYECNSLGDLRSLISCQNLVDLHLRVETNLDSSYDEVVKALPKLSYSGLYGSRRRKSSATQPSDEPTT